MNERKKRRDGGRKEGSKSGEEEDGKEGKEGEEEEKEGEAGGGDKGGTNWRLRGKRGKLLGLQQNSAYVYIIHA